MTIGFIEIESREALEQFITNARDGALLFKHSDTCGVSARAYAELAKLNRPVGLITVQKARAISDEIERRWNVAHETPQALIVRDGKLIWDASHFRVRADAIEAALSEGSASR